MAWKEAHDLAGLWASPPRLLTATLDDGLGMGLDLIERFAALAGMEVNRLGLMQKSDTVLEACRRLRPDLLGLTVLQLDSEAPLARIGHGLPAHTRLVAGGPVFKYDQDVARRCGVSFVAGHVGHFIAFLLDWTPSHDPGRP